MKKRELIDDIKNYVRENIFEFPNRNYMIALVYSYTYNEICKLAGEREKSNSYIAPGDIFNLNEIVSQAIEELDEDPFWDKHIDYESIFDDDNPEL